MPDGSDFQTAGPATLKPRKAKTLQAKTLQLHGSNRMGWRIKEKLRNRKQQDKSTNGDKRSYRLPDIYDSLFVTATDI